MAEIVGTPLQASLEKMESQLGFAVSECDWLHSKRATKGPLCLEGGLHYNCGLHFNAPRICCVCWSCPEHRRTLLSALISSRKEFVERETVVCGR
uniref:Uncharacterized protein n=2 Tax=Bird gammacoronavirus AnasCN24 TaxID=3237959 RepID=A0AB39ACZ7_9GAMC